MSTKAVNPCPTCKRSQNTVYVCDRCGKEAGAMPIEVRSTVDGETDDKHFCSLGCLLAARIGVAGVAAEDGHFDWQSLQVSFDGASAVKALAAMGAKVDK